MQKLLTVLFAVSSLSVGAQGGYQPGNVVTNLPFPKVLNASAAAASLNDLKGKITVLDFFGTWCIPCIKALPALTKLQEANKDVKVVLISVEEESKLNAFLAKRPNFPFAVVVDKGESVTALFQPPSLPYTVVLDENGRVLSITEASDITEAQLAAWRAGKGEEMKAPVLPVAKSAGSTQTTNKSYMASANSTVKLSQDFIYDARTNGTTVFIEQLKALNYEKLKTGLESDAEKKAFWINLYNGYTQYFLRQNPERYKDRGAFFKAKQINVAGKMFSLDDIEHGILRRSKIKWSLGHLGKLFPGSTEKDLRVEKLDYRLHFALNCGAKSCPPIAFYSPENLEQQLEMATKAYLDGEVKLDEKNNRADLPAIMGWFRRDFGGKSGMKELLQKHGFTGINSSTSISFRDYDWNLYLDNYRNL